MQHAADPSPVPGISEEYGGPDQDQQDDRPFEVEWKLTSSELGGRISTSARLAPILLAVFVVLAGAHFWATAGPVIGLTVILVGEVVLYVFATRFLD